MLLPTAEWSAICPKKHRHFYLGWHLAVGTTPYSNYDLAFPKDDMSEIDVVCPICGVTHNFKNEDLLRPHRVVELEQADEAKERDVEKIPQLKAQISELKEANSALEKAVKEQDDQIGKFASAYMTLSEFVHKQHGKSEPVEDKEEERVNYEGPKT
jgi:uncharacterized Zn finger protein (UPF0148 family)